MGLLDDPAQLGMIFGLLQGRQDPSQLLMQYGATQEARKRTAQQEEFQKLQREQMMMQLQQQREAQARQQQEQQLAQQFQRPGMPAQQQMGPTPDGSPMPQQPAQAPSFDWQGYSQGMAGIDPMKALQLQSQLAGMGQKESFTLKPGERRYQGDKVVAEGGPESQKVGTVREIKSGSNTITYEWDGRSWQKISSAPTHKPDEAKPGQYDAERGILVDPRTGQAVPVMQGGKPVGPKEKPLTEAQANTSGYLQRMVASEALMKPLEADSGKPGFRESILQRMGQGGEMAANALPQIMGGRSTERQQYRQAQEDWVRAKLRKESGAVIADSEMAREITTYFPQVGDSPEVIAQKARARKVAMDALKPGAGPQAQGSNGWTVQRVN